VAVIGVLAIGALAAGCGGAHERVPPKEARLVVASFLRATQERRFSAACALVTPDARQDLRITALGSFRATGSATAVRLRRVAASHTRARTCPGTLALLASELGRTLTDLGHGVAAAKVTFLGSDGQDVALDDQAWVVTKGDAGWLIASSNAIGDALSSGQD
jgi:hypothetical protein